MSSGFVCTCQEPTAAKRKHWVVLVRHGNYSYFHSSRGSFEDSDYSEVACLKCQSRWRTKAKYVGMLPDGVQSPDGSVRIWGSGGESDQIC